MHTHGGIRFFNIDNAFSWTIQSVEKRPPCTDDKVTRGGREGLNLDKPSHEFSNYPPELHIYIYIYIFVCFEKKGEMNLLLGNIGFWCDRASCKDKNCLWIFLGINFEEEEEEEYWFLFFYKFVIITSF